MALLVCWALLLAGLPETPAASSPGAGPTASPAGPGSVPTPRAYYRPILSDGKSFPVARSTYLSLIEIFDNWHAPRLRLIGGEWRLVGVHEGIDIAAERGTPVLAAAPGAVENLGWTFYSGTRVGLRGRDGRYYLYAHLSRIAPGLTIGTVVPAGALLGAVGNTGYGPPGHRDEFPPHLHFGIEAGATWIDPYATLVTLYRAAVRADQRDQRTLDALASSGRTRDWRLAAQRLYMLPSWHVGE
jgi:murein DD-endopeptidase MepM/ murein hydrolase activator NlpD